MAVLSSAGIGSGLDVNSIVTQLIAVEQQPLAALALKEATFQSRLAGLGSIKGALTALQTVAATLAGSGTAQFRAVSSDASFLSSSASSSAVTGSYSVAVSQLAQAQKLIAAGQTGTTDAIGAGAATTLTFSFGTIAGGTLSTGGIYAGADFTADTGKLPLTVVIGSANNTLAGIRDAINAADGGVTASIVNDGSGTPYRLALSVDDSGAASSLKIDVSGEAAIGTLLAYDPEGTQNLSQTQASKNALLTIDGVPITSPDNSVADAIQGVTLTLAKITSGTPVTVTVARDANTLTQTVAAFVNAYNGLNNALASMTGKGAPLQGNIGALSLQRQVRNSIGGAQVPGSALSVLSQIGVAFQKDGSLKFDATVLGAATASNPDAVSALVAAAGSRLGAVATSMLGSTGPIQSGTDGISRSIRDIDTRRADMQRRLGATEVRLRAQFSALDVAMSSMSRTSAFLTQQFAISNRASE